MHLLWGKAQARRLFQVEGQERNGFYFFCWSFPLQTKKRLSGDFTVSLNPHFADQAQACTLKTAVGKFLKFLQFFSDSVVSILLDSGATHFFIAKHILSKHSLPIP